MSESTQRWLTASMSKEMVEIVDLLYSAQNRCEGLLSEAGDVLNMTSISATDAEMATNVEEWCDSAAQRICSIIELHDMFFEKKSTA